VKPAPNRSALLFSKGKEEQRKRKKREMLQTIYSHDQEAHTAVE
jgi:hypothetical protein